MSVNAEPQSIYTADLPDDLMESAIQQLNKVGAYVDSGGDPVIMGSIHEKPSLLSFIGLTLVLGLIAYVISEIANYYEIRQNWEKYRCQPSIAPFAKFYGHDVTETLNFCAAEAVKEHAPGVIAPIYEGVNKMIGVVDGVYQKAEAIEGGITGLIGGFSNFVTNFANSLGLIETRIRMSVVRIKDIFMRLYGSFIAFVYAGISAITFGNNLICNPLVTFVAGFAGVDLCCFAPDTLVRRADGVAIQIESVVIGTELAGGARVCSTYTFDGTGTKMVRLHGIHVSGNHYVPAPGSTGALIHATSHPEAIPAESLSVIYCLATTTNTIPVVSPVNGVTHEFADYEESYDPNVIAETQRAVEKALNGRERAGPTVTDYSLGIDQRFCVKIHTGVTRVLSDIRLGDILESGARVSGLVSEVCEHVCAVPDTAGLIVSAAQLVFWNGLWQRAGNVWPTVAKKSPTVLCHVLLDGNKTFVIYTDSGPLPVRDYAEHEDDAVVQMAYDRMMGVKGDRC
jgi:hypothetical protein